MVGDKTAKRDNTWVVLDAIGKVIKDTGMEDFETTLNVLDKLAEELSQKSSEFSEAFKFIARILRQGYEVAKWSAAKDLVDSIENLQRTDEPEWRGFETEWVGDGKRTRTVRKE